MTGAIDLAWGFMTLNNESAYFWTGLAQQLVTEQTVKRTSADINGQNAASLFNLFNLLE